MSVIMENFCSVLLSHTRVNFVPTEILKRNLSLFYTLTIKAEGKRPQLKETEK